MEPLNLSREELYELVWAKPVSRLAEELGVKAPDLRKLCRDKDIPLPEQGHWSRIQFGKPVEQIPLPPVREEVIAEDVHVGEQEAQVDQSTRQTAQEPEPPILFPGERKLSFKVPDVLLHPDKLIVAAEKSIRADYQYQSEQLMRTDQGHLPIRASKSNLSRALRIMDTLVKCWRRRGYRIEVEQKETFVYLRRVRQRVSLRELTKKLPKKEERDVQEYEPLGRLVFKMDYWMGREWKDGNLLLEEQILDILNHMELAARSLERSWAEDKEKEQRAAVGKPDEKAVRDESVDGDERVDGETFEALVQEALRWKELKIVDEYLAALIMAQPHTPAFLSWLAWAKRAREAADPLVNFALEDEPEE